MGCRLLHRLTKIESPGRGTRQTGPVFFLQGDQEFKNSRKRKNVCVSRVWLRGGGGIALFQRFAKCVTHINRKKEEKIHHNSDLGGNDSAEKVNVDSRVHFRQVWKLNTIA